MYLSLRFGHATAPALVSAVLSAVDRVRAFSDKLRAFLREVTTKGLQRQYESVCENIGLMAFVLQTEPPAAGGSSVT